MPEIEIRIARGYEGQEVESCAGLGLKAGGAQMVEATEILHESEKGVGGGKVLEEDWVEVGLRKVVGNVLH
jgi:hypothetical protein